MGGIGIHPDLAGKTIGRIETGSTVLRTGRTTPSARQVSTKLTAQTPDPRSRIIIHTRLTPPNIRNTSNTSPPSTQPIPNLTLQTITRTTTAYTIIRTRVTSGSRGIQVVADIAGCAVCGRAAGCAAEGADLAG